MEAARWAPSAGNRQAFRFLVATGEARIRAMTEAVDRACQALSDRVSGEDSRDLVGYLRHFRHFGGARTVVAPIFRVGPDLLGVAASGFATDGGPRARAQHDSLSSVCAAIMQLVLAAPTLGLGACWMTGPLIAAGELGPLLAVPSGWSLAALVPVGFPAEAPAPPRRRSLDQLVRFLDDGPTCLS